MLRRLASLVMPLLLIMLRSNAQVISGTCEPCVPVHDRIHLYEVIGDTEGRLLEATLDPSGRFAFPDQEFEPGFYRLGISDEDMVDIILDPRERSVDIQFGQLPLRGALRVNSSAENAAMWTYKEYSRQAGRTTRMLEEQLRKLAPDDMLGRQRIDSLMELVAQDKARALDAILAGIPGGYFPHIVHADRRLMVALPKGSLAVKDGFDWSDARLLRSSIYAKAILAYLQTITMDTPGGLQAAADSLLVWASPDTSCWRFMRSFLIRSFTEMGFEPAAQYMVDHYLLGPRARVPPDEELLVIAAEQLRVGVGARAPDPSLFDPRTGESRRLSQIRSGKQWSVLFFYSSTCEHCHMQMPGLKSIHQDLGPAGVQVVGIALDTDLDEFVQCLEDRKLPWASYSDLKGWGSQAARDFGIKATPSLVLIGPDGVIAARPQDHLDLRRVLDDRL